MSLGKRLIVICLLVAMVIGIIHIGQYNNILEEENKKQSQNQVETIHLWYYDDSYTDFFTNAAVAFHEDNPDVRVIPTLVDSAEYFENINEASLGNDTFPDIFLLTNDSLEKAYLSGLASKVKDVNFVLNDNHFGRGALSAVTYQDTHVAYPLAFDTSALMYNETYLREWAAALNSGEVNIADMGEGSYESGEQPNFVNVSYQDFIPRTLDDIVNFSDNYVAQAGVESIIETNLKEAFFDYLFLGNYMIVGGDAGDDVTNIDIVNDDVMACVEAYQSFSTMLSSEKSLDDEALNKFLNGETIFLFVSSDAIAKVNEAVEARKEEIRLIEEANALDEPDEADDADETEESEDEVEETSESILPEKTLRLYDFGYTYAPDISADLASRSLSITDTLVINGYSEKKKAANRFAAFVTTKYASQLYQRSGHLSASIDAGYEDNALLIFQEEYDESIPLPKMVETSNLWVQIEIAFEDILAGADAKTRLEQLKKQIDSQIVSQE